MQFFSRGGPGTPQPSHPAPGHRTRLRGGNPAGGSRLSGAHLCWGACATAGQAPSGWSPALPLCGASLSLRGAPSHVAGHSGEEHEAGQQLDLTKRGIGFGGDLEESGIAISIGGAVAAERPSFGAQPGSPRRRGATPSSSFCSGGSLAILSTSEGRAPSLVSTDCMRPWLRTDRLIMAPRRLGGVCRS